jgi:hypothetical protein
MGHFVAEYQAALLDWWDVVLRTVLCPHCQVLYRRHDTRDRAAWDDCEHAQRILILRVRCPQCKSTVTVLPDFLTPYRRYRTPVREAVVAAQDPAPPCDARTARRWFSAFRSGLTAAIAQITAAVLTGLPLGQQVEAFLHGTAPTYAALHRLREVGGRHLPACSASSLLGWINQQLCRLFVYTI